LPVHSCLHYNIICAKSVYAYKFRVH
jgi:hypothetical protein